MQLYTFNTAPYVRYLIPVGSVSPSHLSACTFKEFKIFIDLSKGAVEIVDKRITYLNI